MAEDNTLDTFSGDEQDVPSSDGELKTDSDGESFSDRVSRVLGKTFLTDEAAEKSLKETYRFVGSAGTHKKVIDNLKARTGLKEDEVINLLSNMELPKTEEAKPQQTSNVEAELKELKRVNQRRDFLDTNPDFKDYASFLDKLVGQSGQSYEEVSKDATFKALIEQAKAVKVDETSKRILSSNSRQGQSDDKISQAFEARKLGKQLQAEKLAVTAVMDLITEG